MKLWKKVLIGLVLGLILGLVLKEKVIYIKPFGDIFIRLIKMIIVPLIFFAIVSGISNTKNPKALGRVGIKSAVAYLLTTVFAIIIGLGVGTLFEPGSGTVLNFSTDALKEVPEASAIKILEIFLNIVPENAIDAMAQGTILQVVFFALFTGITLNSMDNRASKRLSDIFNLVSLMVFRMVHLIVQLSPVAACALTAWVVGTQGIVVLEKLLKLIGCAYLAFGFVAGSEARNETFRN